MALRRFCDMCDSQIFMGRYLTVEIKGGSGRHDLRGELSEKDLCEDCAVSLRDAVLMWEEKDNENRAGD